MYKLYLPIHVDIVPIHVDIVPIHIAPLHAPVQ